MADLIDPNWEYWEPDPEIAELIAESGDVRLPNKADVFGNPRDERGWVQGVSFGRRGGKPPGRPRRPDKACQFCGKPFHPSRRSRKYCSRRCVAEAIRFLAPVACATCGRAFYPHDVRSAYCSRTCAAAKIAEKNRKAGREEFAAACREGLTVKQLAGRFGYCVRHVRLLVKAYGLGPRPRRPVVTPGKES